ncbi:uncharacterized protein LOC113295130 [Papaver somniferum]|uniref:uncharacterized protein LOC113295130 n=1 Tax=Papaver somniferum TaxID=3469 RepID=UPI000E6FB72D|nr:uncharacterized protein LOC113295130 [Papaver somniferum]
MIRHKEQEVVWSKHIWNSYLHPSIASNVWKLLQCVYSDDTVMVKNGHDMVSRCCICASEQDSMQHLLWECKFSTDIWAWICSIFKFSQPKSFDDVWKCAAHFSSLIKQVWITTACSILKELWFQKNKCYFEGKNPNAQAFKCRIMKLVNEGGLRITGTKWNQSYDAEIIARFNLGTRSSKFQCIKSCHWYPPEKGFVMFCCDGSSFGNPGSAGFGVVVRDPDFQVIATLTGGIGISSNYLEETYGVMCAMELVVEWKMQKIIIVKVNFSADNVAKKGASLAAGDKIVHIGRTQFLPRVEMPDVVYYRFC